MTIQLCRQHDYYWSSEFKHYSEAGVNEFVNNEFKYIDGKMCEYILTGLNATFNVQLDDDVTFHENYTGVALAPRLRGLAAVINSKQLNFFTYPLIEERIILLVPAPKPYKQLESFLKNSPTMPPSS